MRVDRGDRGRGELCVRDGDGGVGEAEAEAEGEEEEEDMERENGDRKVEGRWEVG